MTYSRIVCYAPINEVEADKVAALAKSILENGWQGCPILVYGEELLTGSHRLAALKEIERMYNEDEIEDMPEVMEQDVAEDVTDIVEENIAKYEEEYGYIPDIDYSNIGWLLEGSWVEEYKDEITEW